MSLVIEGNLIYSIRHVGSSTVKEFYAYVVPPAQTPAPPDPLAQMADDLADLKQQLAVTNETIDFLLGL